LNLFHHQVYGWPLLQSMLSDTFEGEDWLAIWDNLFSNHPGFLLIVVVAYIVLNRVSSHLHRQGRALGACSSIHSSRAQTDLLLGVKLRQVTLLKCKAKNDFQYFFSRQTLVEVDKVIFLASPTCACPPALWAQDLCQHPLPAGYLIVGPSMLLRASLWPNQVIKKARSILKHTPRAINPTHLLAEFVPLSSGPSPVFHNYPAFIVAHQVTRDPHTSLCTAFGMAGGGLLLLFDFCNAG